MRVELNIELTELDGTAIKDEGGKSLTLRAVFCNALITQIQGTQIPGIDKVKRYHLAMEIYKAGDAIELSLDDTTLIRDLVVEVYMPIVVGQVWDVLDPPPGEAVEAPEEPPEAGVDMPENTV